MSVRTILDETIKEAIQNRSSFWVGSPFEKLIQLTNDERGHWGENWIYNTIVKCVKIESTWNGNSNTNASDGTYDMLVNLLLKLRTELKTASRGTGKRPNWQHENIYAKNVWDRLLFVDLDYDVIYVTILEPKNMEIAFTNQKDPILGKKASLRKDQKDKWKFDFSNTTIKNAIAAGYTFRYDYYNPDEKGFIEFLSRKFG
jgi:hypothetical protein